MKQTCVFLYLCIWFLSFSATSASENTFNITLKATRDKLQEISPVLRPGNERLLQSTNLSLYDYMDLQYYANITVGSDNQPFTVMFDTGSTIFWLPGPQVSWTEHNFNCQDSSTCQMTNINDSITYGIGYVAGYYGFDNVQLGDLVSPTQAILIVDYSQQMQGRDQYDGLIGIGNTILQGSQSTALIDNLYFKNQINTRSFSLHLGSNSNTNTEITGSLMIGGYDSQFMQTDDFSYLPVVDSMNWAIPLNAATFGDLEIYLPNVTDILVYPYFNGSVSPNRVVIDSGTSGFLVPTQVVSQMYVYLVSQGMNCSASQGIITCPCNSPSDIPDLTLTSQGVVFYIPSTNYILMQQGYCSIILMGNDLNNEIWVAGDSFFREYYVYYHLDNQTIGFSGKLGSASGFNYLLIGVIVFAVGIIAFVGISVMKKKGSGASNKKVTASDLELK